MAQYIGITGLNRSVHVRVPAYTELDTPPDNFTATVDAGTSTLAADDYFYTVTVVGAQGQGLPATEDSATIDDTDQVVVLSWDEVEGAEGYRVYKGVATGDYTEFFEVDGDTLEYTDDGTAGTAGDVPVSSDAVSALAPTSVVPGEVTIVDVDNVEVRKALGHHQSIGAYAVVAVNDDVGGTALPANS